MKHVGLCAVWLVGCLAAPVLADRLNDHPHAGGSTPPPPAPEVQTVEPEAYAPWQIYGNGSPYDQSAIAGYNAWPQVCSTGLWDNFCNEKHCHCYKGPKSHCGHGQCGRGNFGCGTYSAYGQGACNTCQQGTCNTCQTGCKKSHFHKFANSCRQMFQSSSDCASCDSAATAEPTETIMESEQPAPQPEPEPAVENDPSARLKFRRSAALTFVPTKQP